MMVLVPVKRMVDQAVGLNLIQNVVYSQETILKLGLFQTPLHPPTRTLQETLKEDGDKIVHADQPGFSKVWVGDGSEAFS
ncbi:hypothetical protein AYM40_26690 [Paraburkholderia phytofirmans OLGA172]|uniref:Uncharacterized protein n=1 Tax=Paraburkholderia phytofirmans OLGA172 TaxID=1417228 RepID=A0A160FSJ4_9BURK|nr:hypothetical protein [Paraburkholderia phytofirmans]ANB75891.1 hypothetical protein AYM40_26690 [Paraburkholderia phytofirmans OLGA172]